MLRHTTTEHHNNMIQPTEVRVYFQTRPDEATDRMVLYMGETLRKYLNDVKSHSPTKMTTGYGVVPFVRYSIKNTFLNGYNGRVSLIETLFNKELLDTGKTTLPINYFRYVRFLRQLKDNSREVVRAILHNAVTNNMGAAPVAAEQ